MLLVGYDPLEAYSALIEGAFGSKNAFANTLSKSIPLLFTGLAVAFANKGGIFNVDFSLFRLLEFFVDPKNGDGRNNNPPAMRVRVDCYTKKLPFRVQ